MKDHHDRVTMDLLEGGKRRPGRQKTSPHSPKKQNALAQRGRRERMTEAGYLWRGFWLSKEATAALAALKLDLECSSLDEALERLLLATRSPRVLEALQQPKTREGELF